MKIPFRGQFAIADLLLALTVVAAWTAFAVSQSRIEGLKTQIQTLQKVTGELSVVDPTKYAAIAQSVIRYPDEAWQIHLPEGHTYQLHLVTREIQQKGFPDMQHTVELLPGLHRIELLQFRNDKDFQFKVIVNKEVKLDIHETADWNQSGGSGSTGIGKVQEALAVDEPLVLKRLRVNIQQTPNSSTSAPPEQPVNGLLLWITAHEPAK